MSDEDSFTARLANLELSDQDPFMDATSPNAMVVDAPAPEDLALDSNEKVDVVITDADQAQPEAPSKPLASDCTSRAITSPLLP